MTTRVFLDASVLFSAAYSRSGASREILRSALRREIIAVVSRQVVEEARRNLKRKAPTAVEALEQLMELLSPEVAADPSLSELQAAASYVNLKDAPIIAAAVKANVEYLVTLDRAHFLDDPKVARESGLSMLTPDKLLAILRREE
jgi:putative PIN family toxin of toxin-antitoxin system